MYIVERTAHCTRCHDLFTAIGIVHDSVGKSPRIDWRSPTHRMVGDQLIHRPVEINHQPPCGGTLMLFGSQIASQLPYEDQCDPATRAG